MLTSGYNYKHSTIVFNTTCNVINNASTESFAKSHHNLSFLQVYDKGPQPCWSFPEKPFVPWVEGPANGSSSTSNWQKKKESQFFFVVVSCPFFYGSLKKWFVVRKKRKKKQLWSFNFKTQLIKIAGGLKTWLSVAWGQFDKIGHGSWIRIFKQKSVKNHFGAWHPSIGLNLTVMNPAKLFVAAPTGFLCWKAPKWMLNVSIGCVNKCECWKMLLQWEETG